MDIERDFDMVEIPVEGVAAYWLAISKLLEGKKNSKILEKEAEYTSEPYIRHLLELCLTSLPDERLLELAAAKRDTLLAELARKFDLMRLTLLDMTANENPRKTLAKMTAKFAAPPVSEDRAIELAQELSQAEPGQNPRLYNVDHRMKNEQLVVALLFYAGMARREGKMALADFLEFVHSTFFTEGVHLVVDGFDGPFVRKRLRVHKEAILDEARHKMDMAAQLCVAVRGRLSYEDVFRVARSYMA